MRRFAFPAAIMGMIITPAAIETEEIIRQAVPSRHGRHDVAAGNLIGSLLYFVLFNLGLIALAAPVHVPTRVIALDWPFLIAVTWLATIFLWRGGSPAGRARCTARALRRLRGRPRTRRPVTSPRTCVDR